MATRARLFAAGVLTAFLAACATHDPTAEARDEARPPVVAAAPQPAAAPKVFASKNGDRAKLEKAAPERLAGEKKKEVFLIGAEAAVASARLDAAAAPPMAKAKKNGGATVAKVTEHLMLAERRAMVTASAAASPEFDADAALLARRDAYHKQLKQAAYTFNPLSPIKVATPVTVYFWIDPVAEPMRLAEELKAKLLEMRPGETPRTEAGRIDWSPRMRATLTGDDFDIMPTEGKGFDGQKNLSASRRTEWAWDIKARHVGERLPLHLRVWAILPQELGEPYEVLKLDKLIHVEVTWLWLLDEFWEKYWKWLLGGLGTALAGAIGAWWKSRQPKTAAD